MYRVFLIVYLLVLLFGTVVGLVRYKEFDKASKILVWYIAFTFTIEAIAIGLAIFYQQNNLFIYHLYSPIQFLLLSIYFNFSDKLQKITAGGWLIGGVGIALSVLNTLYLQPLEELNTNFIVLESFLIIGMSLFSFYKLLVSEYIHIHMSPKFWFSSILLVFWSFTFFYWLVGVVINKSMPDKTIWLSLMIWFISIVTYASFAAIFLSYKKMKPA